MPTKKEVDAAGGWMHTTDEGKQEAERSNKRGAFLKNFTSSRARRIAATLYDADPKVQLEVLNAFKKLGG